MRSSDNFQNFTGHPNVIIGQSWANGLFFSTSYIQGWTLTS